MGYEEALQRYIELTNTHKFENVKKLLHKDAVYWFSDKTCTTIEEIQNYFENAWNIVKDEVYSAKDVKWIAISEITATCIYTYQYEGYINGQFTKGQGRATNVFVKDENGDWKLIHEHLSGWV